MHNPTGGLVSEDYCVACDPILLQSPGGFVPLKTPMLALSPTDKVKKSHLGWALGPA